MRWLVEGGKILPDRENVDWFILKGTIAAGESPAFKRLRWEASPQ